MPHDNNRRGFDPTRRHISDDDIMKAESGKTQRTDKLAAEVDAELDGHIIVGFSN